MVKTLLNRKNLVAEKLLFLLFVIFPFGQIIKIKGINPLDFLVAIIFLFTLITVRKFPKWYKFLLYFFVFSLFSWILNVFVFKSSLVLINLLYLVRLLFYFTIPVFIQFYFSDKKEKILSSLLVVAILSAVFGWIQYFAISDTRFLKIYEWDDHYQRIIGTFIDPTFLSLIMVLGIIIATYKKKIFYSLFLILTLLFTYVRAGYLSFLSYIIASKRYLLILIFILFFLFLPKNTGGEGVNLQRTSTIEKRIKNVYETVIIFKKSPVIGVGFNNMCLAKRVYLNDINTDSHSCTGADVSFLFLLATTGVTGVILFVNLIQKIYLNLNHDKYRKLVLLSFLVVFVHSFFANVFFYPFIMLWVGVLVGLGSKVNH